MIKGEGRASQLISRTGRIEEGKLKNEGSQAESVYW
jgi:hypothetical protein